MDTKKRKVSRNHTEIDVLSFLISAKHLTMGNGATAEEILQGANRIKEKALIAAGVDQKKIKESLVCKSWIYRVLKNMEEEGTIGLGTSYQRHNTYYVKPKGIDLYVQYYEVSMEDYAAVLESLNKIHTGYSTELENMLTKTFGEQF